MMNIKIEKAELEDAEFLNKLFSDLLEDDRKKYDNNIKENLKITNFFEKRINLEESIILVAKESTNIIGYIYGFTRPDNKIKKELEAYIDSIYIIENYRNRKIGTMLIIEFINLSKLKKVKYITIDNKYGNNIASYLYNKLGFYNFIETRRKLI